MSFSELDVASVLLRTAVYMGTIAVAGGVFVRATLDMSPVVRAINWQIGLGVAVLLIGEPMRYVMFQLAIAQGDWQMAFDPAMRWMGMQTPFGQAASIRLFGAGIVVAGLLWAPVAVLGAILIVGSYLLEGHTVPSDSRALLAALLFAHLAVVHWWFGPPHSAARSPFAQRRHLDGAQD